MASAGGRFFGFVIGGSHGGGRAELIELGENLHGARGVFRERAIESGERGERLRGGCDGARIERGEVVPGSSRSLIEEITHGRILYRAGVDRTVTPSRVPGRLSI